MAKSWVTNKVDLDPETDLEIKRWADEADRSKRRQLAVLIRRLVNLKKTNPDAIKQLELNH